MNNVNPTTTSVKRYFMYEIINFHVRLEYKLFSDMHFTFLAVQLELSSIPSSRKGLKAFCLRPYLILKVL